MAVDVVEPAADEVPEADSEDDDALAAPESPAADDRQDQPNTLFDS